MYWVNKNKITIDEIIDYMYDNYEESENDYRIDCENYKEVSKMILFMYFGYIYRSIINANEWSFSFLSSSFRYFFVERLKFKTEDDIEKHLKNYKRSTIKHLGQYFFNPKTIGYYYRTVMNAPILKKKGYIFIADKKQRYRLSYLLRKTDLHYEYEKESIDKKRNYKASRRNRFDSFATNAIAN